MGTGFRSCGSIILLVASLLTISGAWARPEWEVHGSANLPAGGFKGELPNGIEYGDAGKGFGFGIEINPATTTFAGWTHSLNVLFNAMESGRDLPPPGSEFGSWVNIPLFTGIRLTKGDSHLRGYGQLQGGVDFWSHTDTDTPSGGMTFVSGWGTSGGIGLGAGLLVKHVHIGFRFNHFLKSSNTITLTDGVGSD